MHPASQHLAFHAAVILLFGLLLGAPYARAIKSNAPAYIVNSWRVAHLSLPVGATLMLAVAALLPMLDISSAVASFIAITLIISSYAFAVSTPMAAITGHRGLGKGGKGWQQVVHIGNMLGAWFSILAALGLVYATYVSLSVAGT